MRVLLTGASGFIGSHLLTQLLTHAIPTMVLLRERSNTWRINSQLPQVERINTDALEPELLLERVQAFAPDVLIHLAWYGVENSYAQDANQLVKNITYIQNLFTLAEQAGIKSIIGLGSQAEYGPRNAVLDEQALTQPTTLYGVAKLSAYYLLRALCARQQIRFAWLRLFSSYGPKDNTTWFIPYLILELLQGRVPQLTKGEQRWDYVYVEDVVSAIMRIAAHPTAAGIFNVGSGEANTVKQLAETIRDLLNPSIELALGAVPYRPDQVMHLQADINRLQQTVDWQPQVSLTQGIEKTVRWFKHHELS